MREDREDHDAGGARDGSDGRSSSRWSSVSGLDDDPGWMSGPWNETRFQDPGSGRDRWVLDCWGDGWLVRAHPKSRLQRFVPRESHLPCTPDLLDGERVTLMLLRDGAQKICYDSWRERAQEREAWKGYAFLRLRREVDLFQGATVRGATSLS